MTSFIFPTIGFGTYRIKDQKVFENAILNGYKHFDTAELYQNEILVKNAIDKCSNGKKIHITTKISKKSINSNLIEKSVEERLSIFGYIDLLLLHTPTIDCKKDWETLCKIYKKYQDKILNIGVSNYDIIHLEQIKDCEIKPYCNQIELTPFYIRNDLVNYLKINNIIIVSHTTLTRAERFSDEKLQSIANDYSVSVAKILLQWAIQHNYIIVPRSSSIEHMIENLIYGDIILKKNDMDILDNMNDDFCITKIKI